MKPNLSWMLKPTHPPDCYKKPGTNSIDGKRGGNKLLQLTANVVILN